MTESTTAATSTATATANQEPLRASQPGPAPVLKADFSVTLQSESTSTLNATFQRLMDTIHATPGLSIRGPIRLPKEDKIHSRRIDIKSITEDQLQTIAEQSGIELSQDAGDERIQRNGVVVLFDIE